MAATVTKRAGKGVRKSTLQTRKRRRERCEKRARATRVEDAVNGTGPTIYSTVDYELLKVCGFDAKSRDMRRREPPTRMVAYPAPPVNLADQRSFPPVDSVRRLNRRNGWHMDGESRTLVSPKESALWLWWLSLGDEAQDEVADLSAKCSDVARDGGGTDDAPEPAELIERKERPWVMEGEDAREWGRVK